MTLNTQSLSSLAEVRAFLDGSTEVSFSPPADTDRYDWLEKTLRQFHYTVLKRADKGLLQVFMRKVTGYPRSPRHG